MIKVVIIEDELKTRKLIQLMLDWETLGFTCVGEASNGQDGLVLIKDKLPDLIITDIKMPIMDGLDFSKSVLKRNPKMKIIIITAFDEFNYAQQAIKLGVFDFLLKPIKREELKKALERVKEKIEREKYNNKIDVVLNESSNLIDQVLYYMIKNLGDSDLSLSNVAKEFFVNPSYLSRSFKKKVGTTFVEYLTSMRMEKAIQYLEQTDKKVYVISELVGISDPAYFGKCFKKYKNMTIQEYRNRNNSTNFS